LLQQAVITVTDGWNRRSERPRLRCAALLRNLLRSHFDFAHTHGAYLMETNKHFVRGVLQAGVWLMKLPGGLGGQLTELVAIRNVGKSPIYQIGTHENSLSFFNVLGAVPHEYFHWKPTPQFLLFLNI
jgi:hypothetical protein